MTSLDVTSVRFTSAGSTLIKCWNFKEVIRCKNSHSAPEENHCGNRLWGSGGLSRCPCVRGRCLGVTGCPGSLPAVSWQPDVVSSFPRSSSGVTVRDGRWAPPRLTPGHISRIPGELWTVTIGTRSQKGNNNKTKQKKNLPISGRYTPPAHKGRSAGAGVRRLKNSKEGRRRGGTSSPAQKGSARTRRVNAHASPSRFFLSQGQLAVTACFIFGGRNRRLIFQLGGSPHSRTRAQEEGREGQREKPLDRRRSNAYCMCF